MSNTSMSSEKYLISSLLRNGDMKTAMAHGVNADMFHAFKDEWEWIETFYMKHKKVPSKATFRTQFDDFVIKAIDDTGHFAEEVKKTHSRFLMTTTMKEVADMLASHRIEEAVHLGYQNMIKIASSIGVTNDSDIFSSFEDIADEAADRRKRVRTTGSAGIPTGFETLDDRTGGPQPGDLWIVGARLGEGKSWTLQKMATAGVLRSYTVQFDALEQTRAQVAYRIHSFMSSKVGEQVFNSLSLMQGRDYDHREYKKFLRKMKSEVKGRLHVSDASRGRVGLTTVAAQIERNQPDIVFIDYLTLMDKKGGDWQDVAALSGGLKQLAAEYQIPIVAAAQLNRGASGREPAGAENLAQSDSIGQDCDVLITMKQTSPHTTIMKTAKNRNGEGGFKWYNHFNPGEGIFDEVSHDRYLELKDMDADAS